MAQQLRNENSHIANAGDMAVIMHEYPGSIERSQLHKAIARNLIFRIAGFFYDFLSE